MPNRAGHKRAKRSAGRPTRITKSGKVKVRNRKYLRSKNHLAITANRRRNIRRKR